MEAHPLPTGKPKPPGRRRKGKEAMLVGSCLVVFLLLSFLAVQSQPISLSTFLPAENEEPAESSLAPSELPFPSSSPSPSPMTALSPADLPHADFAITNLPVSQKPLLQVPCTAIDFLRPKPPLGVEVVINLRKQRLTVLRYKQVLLESPISSGRPGHRTAAGSFEVTQKDLHHYSTLYGYFQRGRYRPASMKYFVRYNGAEGLHAGDLPGYAASHGCVRLPTNKAAAIFKTVGIGTPVVVTAGESRRNSAATSRENPRNRPTKGTRNVSQTN